MTMAEKVLARTSGRDEVTPGEFVTARIDLAMCHEAMAVCGMKLAALGIEKVWDPERVVVILDHFFPAPTVRMAAAHTWVREMVENFALPHFLGHAGICHQVLTERGFIHPGELVLGSDSHSTTYGALGAAGAGIGVTEMTYVLATGELWMRVPPTTRFWLEGDAPPGCMAKDVILHLAGTFGTDVAQYEAIEYAGPLAERMSIAGRMTLSNLGVELGAKFAMFEADARCREYLAERDVSVESFGPDSDAVYADEHRVDISNLSPRIALPHSPGNVRPIEEVEPTRVHQAFIGSCTNGRLEDLAIAADVLRGRHVHEGTRLIVTPASQQVQLDATRAGYIATLLEAGAFVTSSGCGACPGGHSGVVGPGEVCISSTNRNFRGRMGSSEADVYLASPATVAAAAVTGHITDPREFWTGTTLS